MTRNGLGPTMEVENDLHAVSQDENRTSMELLLNAPGIRAPGDAPRNGEVCFGPRERWVLTLFGSVRVAHRNYYHPAQPGLNKRGNPKNPKCKKHARHARKKHGRAAGRFPVDDALRLVAGCTPALAKRALEHAATMPYDQAADAFAKAYTKDLTADILKRLACAVGEKAREFLRLPLYEPARDVPFSVVMGDGTGMPMRLAELLGVKGRADDGQARTREVKVGAIFEMTPCPGNREASFRIPDTTTYVCTLERADDFGAQLLGECRRRFPRPPQTTLFIGDGAPWLWELRRTCFPQAVEILDFYHAVEHLAPLLDAAGLEGDERKTTRRRWKRWLLEGKAGHLIQTCEALALEAGAAKAEAWRKALHYYRENLCRMKYDEYLAQGWFIGSGVVESACKTLVGARFKQSGMRWSRVGADALLPLRTAIFSRRYDELWDYIVGKQDLVAAA